MLAQEKMTPGQIILKHQKQAPVNVAEIANDLGIKVWEMRDLPVGISGKIFRDALNGGESGYSIGVRASESYERKRFTVAHEIAHFILHREKIGYGISDDEMYRSGLSTADEVAANKLAAQIIMPWDLIFKLKSEGYNNPFKLAQMLKVSEAAINVRLSSFS